MHFSQELQVVVNICACNFPYQRCIICLEFIRHMQCVKIDSECNLAMRCMCMQLFVHNRFFIMGVSTLSGVNEVVRDAYYLTNVCVCNFPKLHVNANWP